MIRPRLRYLPTPTLTRVSKHMSQLGRTLLTTRKEDRQRSKQFLEALKDGAFEWILSVAGDVRSPDWHDPVRMGM